jgi:hypothetical protein
MGGGLLQLTAYGEMDVFLTGNPQFTFFKSVYRRHTNFAIETIENVYSSKLDYGATLNILIQRQGDLLNGILLEMETNQDLPYSHNFYTFIDYCYVEIGGVIIDQQYGEWMFIWSQLNNRIDQYALVDSMIYADDTTNKGVRRYYAPLTFWFCNNPGLALPLVALTNHEVRLVIKLKELPSGQTMQFLSFRVLCDYIFLDTDEKRRFSQNAHEYLIEQVQQHSDYSVSSGYNRFELEFKHPVKYLTFFLDLKDENYKPIDTQYFSVDGDGKEYNEVFENLTIYLNGQQLFYPRYGSYFRYYHQYKYFKGSTRITKWAGSLNSSGLDRIYNYSFALKASENAPSGSLNMSRIDNKEISFTIADLTYYPTSLNLFKCYAVNYNILRIMSGMGGLVYV